MKRIYLTLISIALFLIGCSKITEGNYDKIQKGMTIDQVNSILGEGMKIHSMSGKETGEIIYGEFHKDQIIVTFDNGQVKEKTWFYPSK